MLDKERKDSCYICEKCEECPDRIRSHLIVKAVNVSEAEDNKYAHMKIAGDICLCLCEYIDTGTDFFLFKNKKITKALLTHYSNEILKESRFKIWKEAMVNTERLFPTKLYDGKAASKESVYILCNATSLFLPGTMNKIRECLGEDDYYIVFVGQLNAAVHKVSTEGSAEKLYDVLSRIPDSLSNYIYKYNKKMHHFEVIKKEED